MSLYKYVSSERLDILESGLIRFTQPGAFNDPFEMKPSINSIASEGFLEKTFQDGFENSLTNVYEEEIDKYIDGLDLHSDTKSALRKRLKGEEALGLVKALGDAHKKELGNIFKYYTQSPNLTDTLKKSVDSAFNKTIGILSLTEKRDNLLMWAHYADSHKGFLIEWDEHNKFFDHRIKHEDEFRCLRKITYTNKRPQVFLAEVEGFEVFFTKSKEWEYEQEWRMTMPLNLAHKKTTCKDHDIYMFEFPKNSIKSIIFGCRMSESERQRLKNLIKDRSDYSEVKIYQAGIDENKFMLNFDEVK